MKPEGGQEFISVDILKSRLYIGNSKWKGSCEYTWHISETKRRLVGELD